MNDFDDSFEMEDAVIALSSNNLRREMEEDKFSFVSSTAPPLRREVTLALKANGDNGDVDDDTDVSLSFEIVEVLMVILVFIPTSLLLRDASLSFVVSIMGDEYGLIFDNDIVVLSYE